MKTALLWDPYVQANVKGCADAVLMARYAQA